MNHSQRISFLQELRRFLLDSELHQSTIEKTYQNNRWFTPENQKKSIEAICNHFLDDQCLTNWTEPYIEQIHHSQSEKIGLIPAGNIPLVGFHDWLCIFITGKQAIVKNSEKDAYWLPYLVDFLEQTNPSIKGQTVFVEQLKGFDKVIATGSNNTSRYFESYFAKVPHIIRKNRQSVAILTGDETDEELVELGHDILDYFGLGCRNVSKIFLPTSFDKIRLFRALEAFDDIIFHSKYKNNFDYNYALYLLNKVPFFHNGSLVFLENTALSSRIAAVHFQYYEHIEEVEKELKSQSDSIQCIVSKSTDLHLNTVGIGFAQQPKLWDYADNINTLEFLLN